MTKYFLRTLLTSLTFAASAEVPFVLTSDLEGRLLPCTACPAASGYPGLARMAAGIADLRSSHENLLLLDTGNALMGGDSTASQGALAAEALMRLRPDGIFAWVCPAARRMRASRGWR